MTLTRSPLSLLLGTSSSPMSSPTLKPSSSPPVQARRPRAPTSAGLRPSSSSAPSRSSASVSECRASRPRLAAPLGLQARLSTGRESRSTTPAGASSRASARTLASGSSTTAWSSIGRVSPPPSSSEENDLTRSVGFVDRNSAARGASGRRLASLRSFADYGSLAQDETYLGSPVPPRGPSPPHLS